MERGLRKQPEVYEEGTDKQEAEDNGKWSRNKRKNVRALLS